MSSVRLAFAADRIYASASTSTLGNAISTLVTTQTQLGGYYTKALRLPDDFDRSRDAHLWVPVANLGVIGPAAGNIILLCRAGWTTPGGVLTEVLSLLSVPIPASWPASSLLYVNPTVAGAPIFPAHTLPQNALMGFRIARDGGNSSDTWAASSQFPTSAALAYNQLCHFCDCP